jgi:hypothetical protein
LAARHFRRQANRHSGCQPLAENIFKRHGHCVRGFANGDAVNIALASGQIDVRRIDEKLLAVKSNGAAHGSARIRAPQGRTKNLKRRIA